MDIIMVQTTLGEVVPMHKGFNIVNAHYGTGNRRIRWMENWDNVIKLQLRDGSYNREVYVNYLDALIVWQRFVDGGSVDDSVSIYGKPVKRKYYPVREKVKVKDGTNKRKRPKAVRSPGSS